LRKTGKRPMIALIKKHKERAVLVGLGLAFLIFVGGGLYLQKKNMKKKMIQPKKETHKVELRVAQSPDRSSGHGAKENRGDAPQVSNAFFLKPSPGELLEELSSMENLREDVAQKKFMSLRVLWPVYFFSLEELDGKTIVHLDVSEDGFGVELRSEINLADFPEFNGLEPGKKLWVGGEIIGVDLSGTGMISLRAEHVNLSAEGPGPMLETVE
jgi:hypothetical protein